MVTDISGYIKEENEIEPESVDDENVTLKKFYPEGPRIRLQPANEALAPIILDGSRVQIQGVVVSVMRKYH